MVTFLIQEGRRVTILAQISFTPPFALILVTHWYLPLWLSPLPSWLPELPRWLLFVNIFGEGHELLALCGMLVRGSVSRDLDHLMEDSAFSIVH